MIRVRLLSEQDYLNLQWNERRFRGYDESHFYDLLREKGDFTDKESLTLLRHLHGEAAVAEKWYRRTTAEGKVCIPAVSREAMYGLVVIENSRNGLYTNIEEAFSSFEVEERMDSVAGGDNGNPLVWTAFANMDMDILLTYRKKDFSFSWDIPIEEEFILENYMLNGTPVDVHVVQEYLRQPELRNGEWYIHNYFYHEKYQWSKEPKELLERIQLDMNERIPLVKGTYSLEAFEDMCWPKETCSSYCFIRARQEKAELLGTPCEMEQRPWQVINHMDFLPARGTSRRLAYLIVEERSDGSFYLWEDISVKYPTYDEMFCEAVEKQKMDCEIFMLAVDVNEVMTCAKDIRKAVCAFWVTGNTIETFGPADGLLEFEKQLRRAVESGNCQITVEN